MQETQVWSLGGEDPLEKGMVTRGSILAWRIPWTEEPGRLRSMASQSDMIEWLKPEVGKLQPNLSYFLCLNQVPWGNSWVPLSSAVYACLCTAIAKLGSCKMSHGPQSLENLLSGLLLKKVCQPLLQRVLKRESSQTINHHISWIPSLKYLLSRCSSLHLITIIPIQVTILIISIS